MSIQLLNKTILTGVLFMIGTMAMVQVGFWLPALTVAFITAVVLTAVMLFPTKERETS